MSVSPERLRYVYEGWEGYNLSLVKAVEPLGPEQLAFSSTSEMRSVGEVFLHIGDGRVDWFQRLNAPFSKDLRSKIESRTSPPSTGKELASWLNDTWRMVEATLAQWTVHDLQETFVQPYQGKTYAVSRQWVIWRIMAHDIQHGGQLSELLAMQDIFPTELTYLGGHLTEPEVIA